MPNRGGLDRDVSSEKSRMVACLGIAFHALTLYEEVAGTQARLLDYRCELPRAVTLRIGASKCSEQAIDDTIRALRFVTRLYGLKVAIECDEGAEANGLLAEEVVEKAVLVFIKSYADLIAKLVQEPYEHFLVLAWNGAALVGQGGEDKVDLPAAKLAILLHTHPRSYCLPSGRDVESAAALLAEGGLASIVAGGSCLLVISARRPISEDDYWTLMELSGRLKRVRRIEELQALVSRMFRLESLNVYVLGLTGV
jgi:hypothetical protein